MTDVFSKRKRSRIMTFDEIVDSHPDSQALKSMLELKGMGQDHFAQAVLVRGHPGRPGPDPARPIPAGARVLITVFSRLGHLCVRGQDVDSLTHGYDRGVFPEDVRQVVLMSPPPAAYVGEPAYPGSKILRYTLRS